jgi:hypothetical protein
MGKLLFYAYVNVLVRPNPLGTVNVWRSVDTVSFPLNCTAICSHVFCIHVIQGLRELLEISQRHASLPKIKRTVTHAEQSVQTDPAATTASCNNNNNALCDNDATNGDGLTVEITLPMPPVAPPRTPKAAKATGRMVGGTALTGSSLSIARVESSPEPGGYFTFFFVIYHNRFYLH